MSIPFSTGLSFLLMGLINFSAAEDKVGSTRKDWNGPSLILQLPALHFSDFFTSSPFNPAFGIGLESKPYEAFNLRASVSGLKGNQDILGGFLFDLGAGLELPHKVTPGIRSALELGYLSEGLHFLANKKDDNGDGTIDENIEEELRLGGLFLGITVGALLRFYPNSHFVVSLVLEEHFTTIRDATFIPFLGLELGFSTE